MSTYSILEAIYPYLVSACWGLFVLSVLFLLALVSHLYVIPGEKS